MARTASMARTAAGTRTAASNRILNKNFGSCIYTTKNNQDRVNFGNILLSNTAVTAAIWVNFRTNSSSNYDVFFGYTGTARWYLIRLGNGNSVYFAFRSGGIEKGTGIPSPQLKLGKWYLCIGTHDPSGGSNNTTIRVYDRAGNLYNSASATNAFSIDSTANSLFIGRDVSRNTSADAKFDEARIYSRVLTVAEQNNLALNIEPSTSGLIGYWKFDEGSGSTANDSAGSNNGTLIGATIAYSTDVPSISRTAA